MLNRQTEHFISQNGEWTAMAIKLPDGTYTRNPAPDHRLKRLLQIAGDTLKKPISECRVLDLACLEGHYAIEFALHGATVVGIEGRQVSVDKCNYAKNALGLTKASFVQDDVRNLSVEKYGRFDVVVCSGILYHLQAKDAAQFVLNMADVCTGILLIDTFVSLKGRQSVSFNGAQLFGHEYFEHASNDDARTRSAKLWASLDNDNSFWFTQNTLVNLLIDGGFTSVMEVLVPTMVHRKSDHSTYIMKDRRTYIAIKGSDVPILSSDLTQSECNQKLPENVPIEFDQSQKPRGKIFHFIRRVLPPSVKDAGKRTLRAIKVLPPDSTPDFMKRTIADRRQTHR